MLQRVLEILTYLATNHSAVANMLFYFDPSNVPEASTATNVETKKDKGKEIIEEGRFSSQPLGSTQHGDIPLILFLKLLNQPLFLRSTAHLEQVLLILSCSSLHVWGHNFACYIYTSMKAQILIWTQSPIYLNTVENNQYAFSSLTLDESSAHLINSLQLLGNCSNQLDSTSWYKTYMCPEDNLNFSLFFLVKVMGLLQVVVCNAETKLDCQSQSDKETQNSQNPAADETSEDVKKVPSSMEPAANEDDKCVGAESSTSDGKRSSDTYKIFLQLPQFDLCNLCSLLGREGYYSMILCALICSFTFSVVMYLTSSILCYFLLFPVTD